MKERKYIALLVAAFLSFPCLVFAQEWNAIDISDFTGGLNTRDGVGGVADNELTASSNTYLLARGIAKRYGFDTFNNSTRIDGAEQGTGFVYANVGGTDYTIATAGNAIAYQGNNVWTDITGSVSITAEKQFLWATVNGNLVGVNGTDNPIYWSGTGNAATLTGDNIPTAPTCVANYSGRLFLAQGKYLYWSEYLGNWAVFHPDDYQPFESNITGLMVFGASNNAVLLVWTEQALHTCTFNPYLSVNIGGRGVFSFDTISNKHGCVSPYSVQECLTPDGSVAAIWADRDGIKALSGSNIINLTEKIQPTWDGLSFADLDESIGIYYEPRDWYLLVCREQGESSNNTVIVIDLRYWCVSGIFDWAISSLGTQVSGGEEILVGSDYNGYWHRYDYGTSDGGTAISSYFQTKAYDNNDPLYDKAFESVVLTQQFFGRYDLSLTAYCDFSQQVTETTTSAITYGIILGEWVLGQDKLAGDLLVYSAGNEITGRGRNIMVRIADADMSERFVIYRIVLPYQRGRISIYQ